MQLLSMCDVLAILDEPLYESQSKLNLQQIPVQKKKYHCTVCVQTQEVESLEGLRALKLMQNL